MPKRDVQGEVNVSRRLLRAGIVRVSLLGFRPS